MIETYTKQYWLGELKESGAFLETLYRNPAWDQKLEFECEKVIFLGFYSIRKLLESNLLKPNLNGLNTELASYLPKAGIDFESQVNEKWTNAYNLIQAKKSQLSLKKLCNQFIHSKIYSPFVPGGLGCVGFYFCSDNKYKELVYYIQLVKVIEIFLSIAHEEKVQLSLDIENGIINVREIEKHA